MLQSFTSYQEARNTIENGDIVFIKYANTFMSRVIAFFTRGIFTHVGIAFWISVDGSNERRLMIVEAQRFTRRRIVNFSFYGGRGISIVRPKKSWRDVQNFALKDLGIMEYSWLDVIYVGLREFTSNWIKLPYYDFKGEICSEYVAQLHDLEESTMSPQKLFTVLSTHNGGKATITINMDN